MDTTTPDPTAPVGWRTLPIDGALFAFHAATGTCVRWDGPATRALRACAPRVVLFGLTNACNLRCGFCSRDVAAKSTWDVDSAFELLSGLEAAGVLEVAFGGGEPLLFPDFDVLLSRLAERTSLAVHVTTNGTRIDDPWAERLASHTGEVRLSIYEDCAWRTASRRLARAGARFGANVVVTPANLARLPDVLDELRDLGGHDVAFLRYVGDDLASHLAPGDEARLAEIVRASPLTARLSVCFGDRLPDVPRLFTGDCGAGRDFVTVTSDRRVRGCSFQENMAAIASAGDVIDAWRTRRDALGAMANRFGCARPLPSTAPSDGVRIWRSYAGNNSGDCVLVGRFDSVDAAEALVDDVLPGFEGGGSLSSGLQQLLTSAGVDLTGEEAPPEALCSIGRNVFVMDYWLDDVLPWMRHFVATRRGRATFNGIHVHEQMYLVGALRSADKDRVGAIAMDWCAEAAQVELHGQDTFGVWPVGEHDLVERVQALRALEGPGVHVAGELLPSASTPSFAKAFARRFPQEPWWMWGWVPDEVFVAQAAARHREVTGAGRHLLARVDGDHAAPRGLERAIYRAGGYVTWVPGEQVVLTFGYWAGAEKTVTVTTSALRSYTSPGDEIALAEYGRGTVRTASPTTALVGLEDFARGRDYEVWLTIGPRDGLVSVLARLSEDLGAR